MGTIRFSWGGQAATVCYFSLRSLLPTEAGARRAKTLILLICLLAVIASGVLGINIGMLFFYGAFMNFTREAVLYVPDRQPTSTFTQPDGKVDSFVKIPDSMLPRHRKNEETPL